MISNVFQTWKRRAKQLELETYTVYLAYRDPRVPWYARIFAACVVAYAFSPIDLIPDPIPIVGYLDDLVLVPLGIALVIKMIPPAVWAECHEKAQQALHRNRPANWVAAGIIIAVWLLLSALAAILVARAIRS